MGLELSWIGRIPVPYKPNFTGFVLELTRKTPETPQRNTRITLLLRYCGSEGVTKYDYLTLKMYRTYYVMLKR